MKGNNKLKIGIIVSWYGPYPWYFPYFIQSCSYNDTIDFFIITDNRQQIPNKPKNVKIIEMSLEELSSVSSERLDVKIEIEYSYKLCDLRPAYGFIFPEILKDYKFWGYGDIDVIYGNIRHFLTERLLENNDVFSFRPEYLTGSLTIYRNTKNINELFLQSMNYKTVFSQREYLNFDECNFLFDPLWEGKAIETIPNQIESMTHVVRRKAKEGCLRAYFDFNLVEGTVGNVKWTNGEIIYKNRFEAMFYHFLKFKDTCQPKSRKIKMGKNDTVYFSKNNMYKRRNK